MPRSLRQWLPSLVTLCLCGCASLPPSAAPAPEETLDAFVSALNRADLDALTGLLAADATAFLPLDSAPSQLVGKDAIRGAFQPFFQELRQQSSGPEYMRLVARDVRVQHRGRVAVVSFEVGSGPVASRRTLVLERRRGVWLVTHFHGSNIRQKAPAGGG